MKKSISILFCLFMFPLSISTGHELREGYHVDYDSLPPGCPSVTDGDDAARIECFQNNEKAYRESLMEIQRQNEALLEGIDKIHNEGSISQRKTIDEQQQGINALSSLLQECRTTSASQASCQADINGLNIALEESRVKLQAAEAMSAGFQEQLNQSQSSLADKDVKIADQQVKIDELIIQLETIQKNVEGQQQGINEVSSLLQQCRTTRDALQRSGEGAITLNTELRTKLDERSAQLQQTTAELADSQRELQAARQGPPPIQRVIGGRISCHALREDIKAGRPEASGWSKSPNKYEENGKWVHAIQSPCLWPE